LKEQGVDDVTVVNAGVSGDTTTGGLARLEWTLPAETDAVILELGGNDLLRGIPPELTRRNLDEMMRILTDKNAPVLLAGIRAFGNYGEDYRRQFNAIYPELAEKYDAALYPSFLEALGSNPDLFLPNDFHPNTQGVRVLVEDIGPLVIDLIDAARARDAAAVQ
ncbi:MAG: arylesterase, partial [Pseudomonadota bacterium]